MLATGYELIDIVPGGEAPGHLDLGHRDAATAAKIWPGAAFVWEASDPYLYMRATADGRVICGGEDEEFTDESAATP